LWSLVEDVVIETPPAKPYLVARTRCGPIHINDRSTLVREALYRMALGPVALDNIPQLKEAFLRWRGGGGTGVCQEWHHLRQILNPISEFVVASLGLDDGSAPVLSAVPSEAGHTFRLAMIGDIQTVRLAPQTEFISVRGEEVMWSPVAAFRVLLHRPIAASVAHTLTTQTRTVAETAAESGQDVRIVRDILAYLTAAGLVTSHSDQ
jgi:hypothetical protein